MQYALALLALLQLTQQALRLSVYQQMAVPLLSIFQGSRALQYHLSVLKVLTTLQLQPPPQIARAVIAALGHFLQFLRILLHLAHS